MYLFFSCEIISNLQNSENSQETPLFFSPDSQVLLTVEMMSFTYKEFNLECHTVFIYHLFVSYSLE